MGVHGLAELWAQGPCCHSCSDKSSRPGVVSPPLSVPHDESCPGHGLAWQDLLCCQSWAGRAELLRPAVPMFSQTDWSHAQSRSEPYRLMGWFGTVGTDDGAEPCPSCPSRRVTKQRKQLTGTARSSDCACGHHLFHCCRSGI